MAGGDGRLDEYCVCFDRPHHHQSRCSKHASPVLSECVTQGSKFFYETNGTQFFIRGVAYQQSHPSHTQTAVNGTLHDRYADPIAEESDCLRDIPYLTRLRTNVIRIYTIDPAKSHEKCMKALADAGIYVIVDLPNPDQSIVRSSPVWSSDLYLRYTQVIDAMANYTNTFGFLAGNEVTNDANTTAASVFVKAAVRDMKAYIKQKNYRSLGVGYATSDDASIRAPVADYLDCGRDRDAAIDFLGYNIYSWCGDSSYRQSGYSQRTDEFEQYDVPVFFAEYGCNTVSPREFSEVQALYGDPMTSVWSGGIVYMYFQEANNYGLVVVDNGSVSTLDDFNNLSRQIASATPSGPNAADYSPSNTAPAPCPTAAPTWAAVDILPPTPDQELCPCMYSTLHCVPHNVSEEAAGSFLDHICGLGAGLDLCSEISVNTTAGTYGAYSMCSPDERLGWALNAYYLAQPRSSQASACDFGGSATTRSPVAATGACSASIAAASLPKTDTNASAWTSRGRVDDPSPFPSSGVDSVTVKTSTAAVLAGKTAIVVHVSLVLVGDTSPVLS